MQSSQEQPETQCMNCSYLAFIHDGLLCCRACGIAGGTHDLDCLRMESSRPECRDELEKTAKKQGAFVLDEDEVTEEEIHRTIQEAVKLQSQKREGELTREEVDELLSRDPKRPPELPELPQREYSEEEQLRQVLPLRMVKQREREEQKEVDKPCKFHVYGYPCYEELKWGYCPYVHAEEVQKAMLLAKDRSISATQLLGEIEADPSTSGFLKKCLRFAPEPPSRAELLNVRFELERRKQRSTVSVKQQASTYRKKQKEMQKTL